MGVSVGILLSYKPVKESNIMQSIHYIPSQQPVLENTLLCTLANL